MRSQIDRLATLARELLPKMHDDQTGLYPQKVVWSKDGARGLGSNRLYSAMTAIGIIRDNVDLAVQEIAPVLDSLHALALAKPSTTGELGATVWALAESRHEGLNEVLRLLVSRLRPSVSTTMELGLVLSALAATIDASEKTDVVASSAAAASNELLNRFSNSGRLFRGSAPALRPRRALQSKMTSFASQVYPVLGLAEFARATGTSPPSEVLEAADRLVAQQGPLGQWWWIYSPRTGGVVERYPVYSVHQHAMALMALGPLENLGLRRYRTELALGVDWVFGNNELQTPLVDFEQRLIARCIQRSGADADGPLGMSHSQWRAAILASWSRASRRGDELDGDLEVLWECRPYELGWLLYARSLIREW